ncbi:SHOCT domain-containing protein [Thioalkalivibrio paradoxus]|uniref:Electron transporter RnfE n=1 Tax=Thioalkalivibrio paradoxus ARh 1 TaxID=713585 RepID=W0DMZ2_9GAMM|nr:SHOCT domain-containing protein [Thioalkalivibrio paradoxus]AHE98358.1 electron transporter RnfE [Thioalkalivibrio paradoxus ARh 1]
MMDGYGFGHGFGILSWVLIFLVVVVVAVFLSRAFGDGNTYDRVVPHDKSPLDILKERYARGEIDHDEFEKRKRDLQGRGSGP